MNFKHNESATKLRGGYYTRPDIARFLLRWVNAVSPSTLLEPSCGDGVFFRVLAELDTALESVTGFEISAEEASKANQAAMAVGIDRVSINHADFLGWALKHLMAGERFDAVVGNPPFIRYQYCEPEFQEASEQVFSTYDLRFTRHTNAWVPFVIASIGLLNPKGRLAMVVPAELLHVLHAQSLRQFLASQCERILLFDPKELWFEDALQGAVLLLAEKKAAADQRSKGVGIISTSSDAFLEQDPERLYSGAAYANGATIEGKWTLALLTDAERSLLKKAESTGMLRRFGDIAEANVGIVTGANKFFLVPDDIVEDYDLHEWAHPMFGRSDHVPGVIYDREVHEANRRAGKPTNFIWFEDAESEALPPKAREYIALGESQELHKRYKCRIRTPWYTVPSVYSTGVGMLKRSHDYPRLIHNQIDAYTTDTAYRVRPKDGIRDGDLVFSFVNSATALSAELEGRHYGGGVLELVPSEIESLLVPLVTAEAEEIEGLDEAFKRGIPPEEILKRQDKRVLAEAGFTPEEAEQLRVAWKRMRDRRQRNDS